MKKFLISLFMATTLMPVALMADSYTSLWKQYSTSSSKDLPKTSIGILQQIIDKATAEKAYGHLLKAQLLTASLQTDISPDSLEVEVDRLKAKEQKAESSDPVLAAVYQSVLGRLYRDNGSLDDDHQKISKEYYKKSLQNPSLLASSSASSYEPFVIEGNDSKIFYGDLLHVIGFEAEDYQILHDYYLSHKNRPAACICAFKKLQKDNQEDGSVMRKSKYLQSVDSLINVYKDLREAGELAIEHYNCMSNSDDATAEDKINYINYALNHWGVWPRMNVLRNAQSDLMRPSFNVNIGDELSLPGRPRKVLINSVRNINALTMNVWHVNVAGDTKLNPSDANDYNKIKSLMTPVGDASQTLRYIGQPAYKEITDSMSIQGLPVGVYLVEFITDNNNIAPQRALLRVSDMFVVSETLPNKSIRLAALSATTGKPVPNAKIRLTSSNYYGKQDEVHTLTCGENGEATYKYTNREPNLVYVYTDADKAAPELNLGGYFSYYDNERDNDIVNLYTDRKIYRPGQTVHVAALVYLNKKHTETSAQANKLITFTLRDANRKVVAENQVTTDNFGMASTDFILPQSGLTGQFSINSNFGSGNYTYFSVEEYKRPTFQVDFDKAQTKYAVGDTVTITGHAKSFAGVPVQGAKVKYTVTRRQSLWWWYRNKNDRDMVVMKDTLVTGNDGSFKVRVPMVITEEQNEKYHRFFNFEVEASVTDVSGETRSGETSLPLSSHPTAFSCDVPQKILSDSLKTIRFTYKNNAGADIPGDVTYWIDGKRYSCKANAVTALNLTPMKSMNHQLKAVCGNDTIDQNFITFSLADKKAVTKTHDWFYQSANTFPVNGGPVYIQVGSSDAYQHILYTMISGNNVLENGVIDQSDALTTRAFNYKEEYGNGVLLTYTWVKEGVMYTHNAEIRRPLPDKHLNMKWTTFRDRLTPGQKEEWSLQITNPDGTPAKAQLLATMYDKSLDQIRKHGWAFNPTLYLNLPNTRWYGGNFSAVGLYGFMDIKMLTENAMSFSHFDDEVFNTLQNGGMLVVGYGVGKRGRVNGLAMSRAAAPMMMAAKNVAAQPEADQATNAPVASVHIRGTGTVSNQDETDNQSQGASDQVRENLNETAFFYPALITDGKGNVAVKFTLPESITTWRFMGLAHDALMNYGMIDAEAVAKKTVMIQPNVPRFVRMGDKAEVSARIFNTSSNIANGTATMQMIDAETEKVILTKSVKYTVKPNETGNVSFDVVPTDFPALTICRITANGPGYSDGEQHYLPILPDKEMVTSTVPFTQNGPGIKTIDLAKLFPVKDNNNKLTIEYTNNPAWLMVQALPSVANANDDNAISLAAAYYANSIASNILHQSPEIQQTINLWKQESGNETSLMSNLQKNQELKSLVLDETPWVAEADHETDQKQQLINLFDESNLQYRLSDNIKKLSKLQNPDGSWSWWPDMPGNLYMTVAVSEMLTRLNVMIGNQDETTDMLSNAFSFMNKKMKEEVAEMKKEEKKGAKDLRPSETAVRYLYISSLRKMQLSQDGEYLVKHLAAQTSEFTIYGKALAAVIFANNGYVQKAKEYLQSVREYTVYKEEMGRYFDTPKAYYSWFDYRIPTEVAAIEAIKAIQPEDKVTVEEMQRWLLQEKRTQSWDTPINSVNAVYAFLNGETSKLITDKSLTTLKVDGKTVSAPKATAGLGYVKASVTGDDMKTFSADKKSQGTSWGAVYAQYMQKATDIDNASAGLTVKREVIGASGNATQLKVGDRVKVRITITADRDYDFVQLIDKRAACMEPIGQLSGYHWGYYCAPRDNSTNYYFDILSKGKHTVETEYYVDRAGQYQSGTCTVQCAYSPEYTGRASAQTMTVVR